MNTSAEYKIASVILYTGLALRIAVLLLNPLISYDPLSHIAPVKILMTEGRLWEIEECWECHQPPLFYVACAFILKFAEYFCDVTPHAEIKILQTFSGIFGIMFLLLAYIILKRVFSGNPRSFVFSFALIALNAQFASLSSMFTNDMAVSLLILFTLYLAHRFTLEGDLSFFRMTILSAVTALGILTKYNAVAVIPSVLIYLLFFSGVKNRIRSAAFYTLLTSATISPWFARNMAISDNLFPIFKSFNLQMEHRHEYDFLSIPVVALLKTPFELDEKLQNDPGARLPYVKYQILNDSDRSFFTELYSLFLFDSTYHFPVPPPLLIFMLYLSGLPLVLFFACGIYLFLSKKILFKEASPFFLLLAFQLISLLIFAVEYPLAEMGTVKSIFIFASTVPFALFAGIFYGNLRGAAEKIAVYLAVPYIFTQVLYGIFIVMSLV